MDLSEASGDPEGERELRQRRSRGVEGKQKKKKRNTTHAGEARGLYANLQSPNSKSLKLGCNAEDEPM